VRPPGSASGNYPLIMFNPENTRLTLKSSEIKPLPGHVDTQKKLYFVDLVKIVNDQFNKNAA